MATRRNTEGHEPTLTERARRAQLIEVTRELIAARGYGGTSLASIAEAAGVTKAAVLYYFPTKAAVVEAAYREVLTALTGDVAAAVETADPADGPAAYIRSMIGHLREHPEHVRMIIEAIGSGEAEHEREERWRPLAGIIDQAARARGSEGVDARTLAVIVGGGIDAIVSEQLDDPGYDSTSAAEKLVEMTEGALVLS